MTPRSFNGWRDWAMANLNYTMGEAEEYARRRLTEGTNQGHHSRIYLGEDQDELFQDSEREAATGDHPPQDEVRRSPQRQPRPPAPSYDPRTSDWQGF